MSENAFEGIPLCVNVLVISGPALAGSCVCAIGGGASHLVQLSRWGRERERVERGRESGVNIRTSPAPCAMKFRGQLEGQAGCGTKRLVLLVLKRLVLLVLKREAGEQPLKLCSVRVCVH